MPDVIVVADVLHHLTPSGRKELFLEIRDFTRHHRPLLVVKEVAPQGWRARLGLLSDRYVTGDRHASLVTPDEVKRLVLEVFPDATARDTSLMEHDHPNYCIVFEMAGDRALMR